MKETGADRVLLPDSIEDVFDYAVEQRWTDGLPIIPPTADRVARMVSGAGLNASVVIGLIPPANNEATVEKVAVSAVMAGCRPEYMPVVVAALQAMMEPQYNLDAIQTTTTPAVPMIVVNGPIRDRLDLNYKRGALGPGWRANATIGRAVRLALMNIGEALPGEGSNAYHAWPAKYTFCMAEWEEKSLWSPLHVERGFKADQSTVTAIAAMDIRFEQCSFAAGPKNWLIKLGAALGVPGSLHMLWRDGEGVVILTPEQVRRLTEEGFTKETAKEVVWEYARMPVERYRELNGRAFEEHGGIKDGMIYPFQRPEDIIVLVTGGPEPGMMPALPTWHTSKSVTKAIG